MTTLLLLDVRNDKHYTGTTLVDIIMSTGAVGIDVPARRAVIFGKPDTVSFSDDYAHDELIREVCRRAFDVLTRQWDWVLYRSDK